MPSSSQICFDAYNTGLISLLINEFLTNVIWCDVIRYEDNDSGGDFAGTADCIFP